MPELYMFMPHFEPLGIFDISFIAVAAAVDWL
jgi:hypothetical protein